jgi:predicted NUDIX family NTP pyrophosphohydrolase
MAKKLSAGLLMFRRVNGQVEVFLAHPGGPFWARKDAGAWSLPKGEYSGTEDPLAAAKREFKEETGVEAAGDFLALGESKQPGGKTVTAWAVENDLDPSTIQSNTFSLEWPPKSGRVQKFPEVDRSAWFPLPEARRKILKGQVPFLDRLIEKLGATMPQEEPACRRKQVSADTSEAPEHPLD